MAMNLAVWVIPQIDAHVSFIKKFKETMYLPTRVGE
jgi:hypothetical protein